MDVEGHGDRPENVIPPIRNWLCTDAKIFPVPASTLQKKFKEFENDLPNIISKIGYDPDEPGYGDYLKIIRDWLQTAKVQVSAESLSGAFVNLKLL